MLGKKGGTPIQHVKSGAHFLKKHKREQHQTAEALLLELF